MTAIILMNWRLSPEPPPSQEYVSQIICVDKLPLSHTHLWYNQLGRVCVKSCQPRGVAMLAEILTTAVSRILSEALGAMLKQPVKRIVDEYEMQRAITAAVKRAEDRFARDYHTI